MRPSFGVAVCGCDTMAGLDGAAEAQHAGDRGHVPDRTEQLLPGETKRKRLGISMFMGEVT